MEPQHSEVTPDKGPIRRRWGKWGKQDEPLVYNTLNDLLDLLAEERKKSLRNRRIVKIVLGVYIGFAVLMLFLKVALHMKGMGGMFSGFGGFGGMIAAVYGATQTQRKALKELAQFDDVQMIPRLVEMLEYNAPDLRSDAAALLQKVLPLMKASDAPLLTPEHHAILNRLLSTNIKPFGYWQDELRLSVLEALKQIGNESSLPVVTDLVAGKGSAAKNSAIQRAAHDCLPFLQTRVEHLRQTQTLLRASDGITTSPSMLLRPAIDTATNFHANELLRSGSASASALTLDINLPAAIFNHAPPAPQPEQQQTTRLS